MQERDEKPGVLLRILSAASLNSDASSISTKSGSYTMMPGEICAKGDGATSSTADLSNESDSRTKLGLKKVFASMLPHDHGLSASKDDAPTPLTVDDAAASEASEASQSHPLPTPNVACHRQHDWEGTQCSQSVGNLTQPSHGALSINSLSISSYPQSKASLTTGASMTSAHIAGGNAALFKVTDDDFLTTIRNEEVRRIVKLCFSSLAVVFVETSLPKNPTGPFNYVRMASVPSGAARMLWKALLGSDGHPDDVGEDDDDVSRDDRGRIKRDPSLDEMDVAMFFEEMVNKEADRLWKTKAESADLGVGAADETGAIEPWWKLHGKRGGEGKKGEPALAGGFRLRNPFGRLAAAAGDGDGDGNTDAEKSARSSRRPSVGEESSSSAASYIVGGKIDPFYAFVRDALIETGVVALAGRRSDYSDEESSRASLGETSNKSTDSDSGFVGWNTTDRRKSSRRRKQRKRRTQYLQIQRDMKHQYGVFLSSLPIEHGGFALIDEEDNDDAEDLQDDALEALAREHDTMKRWNGTMANECKKRRIRQGSLGEVSQLNADNLRGSRKRSIGGQQKRPWIFENTNEWPLDDATLYALKMLPSHLMRAGRVAEAADTLKDWDFFLGRLRAMGAESSSKRHIEDMNEIERRVSMAKSGYIDVGGDGASLDAGDVTTAACEAMRATLTERYACIVLIEEKLLDARGKETGEVKKRKKVRNEKRRGETGRALHAIAFFLGKKGHADEAILFYQHALRFKRYSLGVDNISVAGTLHNMGNLYLGQKNYRKAINCYKEALRIERIKLGNKHSKIAVTSNSLGMVYGMTEDYNKAIRCYEDALSIEKSTLGHNHLQVAETLNNLGIVYGIKGEYDKAVQCYEETLRIKKAKLGPEHEECAEVLFNLGVVHNKRGDHDSAVDSYQDALIARKTKLGEDSEEVARILHCLGLVLNDLGELENATKCYEESLRIRLLKLGDDHDDVARTLYNLGLVYHKSGDYDKALECFKGTLRVSKRKLGSKHEKISDTLQSMGLVLHKKGNYENALECYQEALKIRKKRLGNDHLEVAETLHNMGDVYYMMNSFEKAMECYESSFRIRFFKLGNDHVEVAATRNNIGVVHLKRGENQKALECYKEALRVRELRLGADHEKCGDTLHNMGLVHKNLMEYGDAIRRYEQALRVRRLKLGESNNMKVADTLYNMAIVYANSRRYVAALDRYKEALRTYQATGLSDSHPSIANTLQWIKWVKKQQSLE